MREKLHGVKEFFEAFARGVAIASSLALGAIFTVACGATEQPANPTQSSVTATPTGAPSPLLGTWSRTQTCSELVGVLERAGIPTQNVLDAVAGSELIPGVTNGANNIADPAIRALVPSPARTHTSLGLAGHGGRWTTTDNRSTTAISRSLMIIRWSSTQSRSTIDLSTPTRSCSIPCCPNALSRGASTLSGHSPSHTRAISGSGRGHENGGMSRSS